MDEIRYPTEAHDWCFSVEDSSFWFQHRNRIIAELIKQYPPGGRLLDIGGGNGFVALMLQNAGLDVTMIEPGIAGVENARARGVHHVVHGIFEEVSSLDNPFAAASAFDVVEHIPEGSGFLRKIRSSLKTGSRLYLTVPAMNWLWSAEDVSAEHIKRYSLARLESELQLAGFETEYSTYFFSVLVFPLLLLRVIPYRLGLRKAINLRKEAARHRLSKGILGELVERSLNRELEKLKNGGRIGWGTSLFCIAQAT